MTSHRQSDPFDIAHHAMRIHPHRAPRTPLTTYLTYVLIFVAAAALTYGVWVFLTFVTTPSWENQ